MSGRHNLPDGSGDCGGDCGSCDRCLAYRLEYERQDFEQAQAAARERAQEWIDVNGVQTPVTSDPAELPLLKALYGVAALRLPVS